MKKRYLSVCIAGIMAISLLVSPMIITATPSSEIQEARTKYEELTEKINGIETEVQKLNGQIEPILDKVNANKNEITSINREIESTNKEIEQAQKEISEQEEVLGLRLRELYKSGGQTSYLAILFTAESFSDMITKMDSTSRIVKLDQKIVEDLVVKQEQLDEKMVSLGEKGEKIKKINEELKKELAVFDGKKKEQQALIDEAEKEQREFDNLYLADLERELVAGLISTAYNSNNSRATLENTVAQLRAIRDGQLKSPTVKAEVNKAIENAKRLIKKKKEEEASADRGDGVTATGSAAAVINEAYKHIGKPYVWGATGPGSFDCSGLTSYVYRNSVGVNIGRTTKDQIHSGKEVSRANLQPGDLVFPHADHVGIYIGNGNMIHAPRPGKNVQVAPVYQFWRARRILN